jgi:hypothetical protein
VLTKSVSSIALSLRGILSTRCAVVVVANKRSVPPELLWCSMMLRLAQQRVTRRFRPALNKLARLSSDTNDRIDLLVLRGYFLSKNRSCVRNLTCSLLESFPFLFRTVPDHRRCPSPRQVSRSSEMYPDFTSFSKSGFQPNIAL